MKRSERQPECQHAFAAEYIRDAVQPFPQGEWPSFPGPLQEHPGRGRRVPRMALPLYPPQPSPLGHRRGRGFRTIPPFELSI